jgi:hypothetical protein
MLAAAPASMHRNKYKYWQAPRSVATSRARIAGCTAADATCSNVFEKCAALCTLVEISEEDP